MQGVIRKRDVLMHPFLIARCFGWGCLYRALTAPDGSTFLSLVAAAAEVPASEDGDILAGCAQNEKAVERIYRGLAARFAAHAALERFLLDMADQEMSHAELLAICRELVVSGRSPARLVPGLRETAIRNQTTIAEAEARVATLTSVADVLRLVLALEGSEVTLTMAAVFEATDSPFVRGMKHFRIAAASHLRFTIERVADIAPELARECASLDALARLCRRRAASTHFEVAPAQKTGEPLVRH